MSIFLDAAYKILMETNQPLSAEEITRIAFERKLISTTGITPAATMASLIYVDINRKRHDSRFIKSSPGQFGLNPDYKNRTTGGEKNKKNPQQENLNWKSRDNKVIHEVLELEIASLRRFLSGANMPTPSSEKICDWINFCYLLRLYREGIELFSYVDPIDVNDWYYERTKKIAKLCNIHINSCCKN